MNLNRIIVMCRVKLSIIIISHNQHFELERCVSSVLSQKIPFEFEIIISDDRSTDGTWDLIQEYQTKYPHLIFGYQCNSNECNPSMTSERAGYNRINGYRYAQGKYIVHIDGDDYFRGVDSLALQVEMLERHPECTICCQNAVFKQVECEIDEDNRVFDQNKFADEKVLSVDEFINIFSHVYHTACCLRNNFEITVDKLTGNVYDDIDVIYQHIKLGKVVLIDKCDFVYVRYNHITASKFPKVDQKVCWLYQLSTPLIAPHSTGSFFREGLSRILTVVNLARKKVLLEQNTVNYLSKLPAFLFKAFDNRYSIKNRMRLNVIWFWIHIIKRFHFDGELAYKILYILVVSNSFPKNINFKRLR